MKPKNIADLRDQLNEAFDQLRADPRRINQVDGLANVAGKIIGTCKLEYEYAIARGEKPQIDFMQTNTIDVADPVKKLPSPSPSESQNP